MKTPKLQTVAEYCRHGNRSSGIQNKNEQEVMYMIAFRLAVLVAPVIQKGGTSKAVECVYDLNYNIMLSCSSRSFMRIGHGRKTGRGRRQFSCCRESSQLESRLQAGDGVC